MFLLPDCVFGIKSHIPPGELIFLVGGSVRDALLHRTSKDIDYITTSDPRGIARSFADSTRGAFYVLDEERKTCRVLVNIRKKNQLVYDFAQMRGGTIDEDLVQRDFTINAMAVDLQKPDEIIDPYKGGKDLQKKILQPITKTSLVDDPVRCIRAIRYAVAFELKISSETGSLINLASKSLHLISAERKRDELFKILEGQKIGAAIELLHHFEILENLGLSYELDLAATTRRANVLSDVLTHISQSIDPEKSASFYSTSLQMSLGRYRKYFSPFFFEQNLSGRTHASLVQMANLLSSFDTIKRDYVKSLSLSSEEAENLYSIFSSQKDAQRFLTNNLDLNSKEIYQFFKKYGVNGIDLVILTLVDYASRVGGDFSQDHWLRLLENSTSLIQAWRERPEVVDPKPLLNGNALMSRFNLPPGELIGVLLDSLKTEQASGNILNQQQAEDWVREQLSKKS